MSRIGWLVLALAVLEGGWLAFDGAHALLLGDYVTPASGAHAGQTGPWAGLVAAIGIEPRSTLMKSIHLGLGTVWLGVMVCFALGVRRARWGMLACAIAALWYLPFGTLLSAAQIVLLLHPSLRGDSPANIPGRMEGGPLWMEGRIVTIIREERPEDIDGIRAVNLEAFGQPDEGRIVDALRANGGVLLSLVAIMDGRVAGHILYSHVIVEKDEKSFTGAGLGPMSVLPPHQRSGIGSRLIEAGNRMLAERGCPFIVVLGHPDYYPRFGFEPAVRHGIRCEWEVPNEVFMVLFTDPDAEGAGSGLARYRREFHTATL